jgi:hypothetical protein
MVIKVEVKIIVKIHALAATLEYNACHCPPHSPSSITQYRNNYP